MNAESSRSHSIFVIKVARSQPAADDATRQVAIESKVSLIDLAGSERASTAGGGALQTAGKYINQSLTALGKCIAALVRAQSSGKQGAHVPYRESNLTWLLRDVISGLSKTSMLAAISPNSGNIEETLSTLRWASSAKKIAVTAQIQADPTDKLIQSLKTEIAALKAQLRHGVPQDTTAEDVMRRAEEADAALAHLSRPWRHKLEGDTPLEQPRSGRGRGGAAGACCGRVSRAGVWS